MSKGSPPYANPHLIDLEYMSEVADRIKRKVSTIRGLLKAGDTHNAAALLMAINDDTMAIATAWHNENGDGQPEN